MRPSRPIGLAALLAACAQHPAPRADISPVGFIPDSATAARMAVGVWVPIYGEAAIQRQGPYHARLVDSVWIVSGSLPPDRLGGVALVEFIQRDGRVVRIAHGR